jgi:hypothetical protein
MKKIAISMIAVLFVVFGLTTGEAKASLTYDLKYILGISGGTLAGSDWLTAKFEDDGANKVKLTLNANLQAGYYIQEVAFNVNPSLNLVSLTIAESSKLGTYLNSSSYAEDKKKLNGGGDITKGFDVLLGFPTANNDVTNRFSDTDWIVLNITGTGITEGSFDFLNTYKTANVAAKIAGNCLSAEVSNVPIPAAAWLFGSGLLGLVGIRRRFQQ